MAKYTLTTAQPSDWNSTDWSTSYTKYYTRSGTSPNYTYTQVSSTMPTWAANTYYLKAQKYEIQQKLPSGMMILHPETEANIVEYDNTSSGLTATTVQAAIDELNVSAGKIDNISINGTNLPINSKTINIETDGIYNPSYVVASNYTGFNNNADIIDNISGESMIPLANGTSIQVDELTSGDKLIVSGNYSNRIYVYSQAAGGSLFYKEDSASLPLTQNKLATQSTVTNAINALDVPASGAGAITGMGAGKTIASLTETDGKIAATFQDISITSSQISDLTNNYSSSGTVAITGTGVNKALETLDVSDLVASQSVTALQTLATLSETDGKISATFRDIQSATTSQKGVVQLSDTIDPDAPSTTDAVTPYGVAVFMSQAAADLIDSLDGSANIIHKQVVFKNTELGWNPTNDDEYNIVFKSGNNNTYYGIVFDSSSASRIYYIDVNNLQILAYNGGSWESSGYATIDIIGGDDINSSKLLEILDGNASSTLYVKQTVEETNGIIGDSSYLADVQLGTSVFKDYTTDTTLATSSETGKLPTSATVKTYVDSAINTAIEALPEPMIFKGSVGDAGDNPTITWTNLPSAAASNEGWTYKVITAHTSAPICKVGDTIISNGSAWVVIPSGDEPSGTVTSVGLSLPTNEFTTGSPVTSSGTLTGSWKNQNINTVFAGPSTGSAGTPTFRALVATDIPDLSSTYQLKLPTTTTAGQVLKSTSTAGTVEWGTDIDTWREIQVDSTQKISSTSNTALNFVSQNTNNGDITFTYDGGIKATAKVPTSFTITVTDDILDGTGGANSVKYAPYSTKGAGHLYTGTTAPSSTNRLNYDGYFYATKLYSGDTEVSVSGHTHTITANATDGIFDITGTSGTNAVTYAVAPYQIESGEDPTAGTFYKSGNNPIHNTVLKYDGYLYAKALKAFGVGLMVDYANESINNTGLAIGNGPNKNTYYNAGNIDNNGVKYTFPSSAGTLALTKEIPLAVISGKKWNASTDIESEYDSTSQKFTLGDSDVLDPNYVGAIRLETEPADWSTNWTDYYVHPSDAVGYVHLAGGESAPSFSGTAKYKGLDMGDFTAVRVNKKGIVVAGGNSVEVGTTLNGTPSSHLVYGGIYYQLISA